MQLSPPNKSLLWISLFSFLGFVDSAYLTADHYFALPLPCSILHGCEKVLTSSYAMVGPIPLALIGVVYYLVVLFFALYLYTAQNASRLEKILLLAMCTVGFVMSLFFEFVIQGLLIHAYCMYCAFSALMTVGLFVAGIVLIRRP